MMERTLFISDLDGTLLDQRDRLPPFTLEVLNRLVDQGVLFTFATARSYHSARVVAKGLAPRIPWIVHNGAFMVEGSSGRRVFETFFTPDQRGYILSASRKLGLWPLVYAVVEGKERVLYLTSKTDHPGMRHYLDSRRTDQRLRPVYSPEELLAGETYYFTFIEDEAALAPLWDQLGGLNWANGTFQQDLYREEYWLELTPKLATKAQAALRLKKDLGCGRLVAFGDAMNDLPLFAAADEAYAVANAMDPVKAAATGIIGSNEENGVARFLLERGSSICPNRSYHL